MIAPPSPRMCLRVRRVRRKSSCSKGSGAPPSARLRRLLPRSSLRWLQQVESDTGFEYRQAARFARWRLPAAATVVLAMGTALIWQRTQALPEVGPLGQDPFAVFWPSDDQDVAGVPMLADLSDEDLALLLEELGG